MIYAKKENKIYQVGDNPAMQKEYLNRGYDLTDENGTVIQHSPVKTVPYSQYEAVLRELESLRGKKK